MNVSVIFTGNITEVSCVVIVPNITKGLSGAKARVLCAHHLNAAIGRSLSSYALAQGEHTSSLLFASVSE